MIKPCGEPLPASLRSTALGEGCSKLCNLSRASQVASSQNHHPACFTDSVGKKSQDGGHTAMGVYQAVRFRGFSFDRCANLPFVKSRAHLGIGTVVSDITALVHQKSQ